MNQPNPTLHSKSTENPTAAFSDFLRAVIAGEVLGGNRAGNAPRATHIGADGHIRRLSPAEWAEHWCAHVDSDGSVGLPDVESFLGRLDTDPVASAKEVLDLVQNARRQAGDAVQTAILEGLNRRRFADLEVIVRELPASQRFGGVSYRSLPQALPNASVQVIPVDDGGDTLLMHRSARVRSARDCWSFPSGLRECGSLCHQDARRELAEELSLQTGRAYKRVGQYENLGTAADPYHWIIDVLVMRTDDLSKVRNVEPDKHDKLIRLPLSAALSDGFLRDHVFGPGLREFFLQHRHIIQDAAARLNPFGR